MPQTLRNFNLPFLQIGFNASALEERPKLMPLILRVINLWAYTDMYLYWTFSKLLDQQPAVAMNVLSKIDSQTVQKAAVLGAAEATLNPSDYLLFQAAVASTEQSKTVRHQFAHHMWGTCAQLPDDLLLLEPKRFMMFTARMDAESDPTKKLLLPMDPLAVLPHVIFLPFAS